MEGGVEQALGAQRAVLGDHRLDGGALVDGDPALQQGVRFNLFTLAQASARADRQGVPAKGVTGSGLPQIAIPVMAGFDINALRAKAEKKAKKKG